MEKVILFASGKGGVGKSSAAVCVGAQIVRRGKRVLLIDADQGLSGLELMLNMAGSTVFDITDAAMGRTDFHRVILPCEQLPGLNLAVVSLVKGKFCSGPQLAQFCQLVQSQFDYILIDGPAGIGSEFQSALEACRQAIVLSTPDIVAMKAANRAASVIAEAGISSKLLVNRLNTKNVKKKLAPNVDHIIDAVGEQLIGIVPEDPAFVRLGGKSLLDLSPRSKAYGAYANIAARICGEQVPLMRF